jgi:hypothetical protein
MVCAISACGGWPCACVWWMRKDKFESGWWFLVSTCFNPSEKWWTSSVGTMKFPINMESHSKFHGSSHHQPVIVRGVSLEVGCASGASLSWPITGCKKKNTAALFLKSPASEKYVYSVYSVYYSLLSLASFFWTYMNMMNEKLRQTPETADMFLVAGWCL